MEWLKTLLLEALKGAVEESKLDDVAEKIISKSKKEIPKHFVAKTDFDEKNVSLKETKTKMEELQTKIEALSKDKGTVEELQTKLESAKTEFETFKQDAEKREGDRKKVTAIAALLQTAKAAPDAIDLLTREFDLDKIILDSKGAIVDAENHLTAVKEKRKGLFETTTTAGNDPNNNQKPGETKPGDWQTKLDEARKSNKPNIEIIKIKQEAAANNVLLL